MAPLLVVASALVGGAVLRVVRTVFLGRGPLPPRHAAVREDEAEDEPAERGRTPTATIATGTILLALGLAWGLVPGLVDGATAAAARFTDRAAYADEVLRGVGMSVPAPPGKPPTTAAWLYGAASGVLAVALAFARTVPEGPLHALHSGRTGDYVAWLAAGAATVAAVFALTLA